MERDTLVTSESLNPEADDACVSACYYVGWSFKHAHAAVAPAEEAATE
jgi:hypothetical protein